MHGLNRSFGINSTYAQSGRKELAHDVDASQPTQASSAWILGTLPNQPLC